MKKILVGLLLTLLTSTIVQVQSVQAQSRDQIRWKTEAEVRAILGEPNLITAPVGTHKTYTLWEYGTFTVAFSNKRAFHLW